MKIKIIFTVIDLEKNWVKFVFVLKETRKHAFSRFQLRWKDLFETKKIQKPYKIRMVEGAIE